MTWTSVHNFQSNECGLVVVVVGKVHSIRWNYCGLCGWDFGMEEEVKGFKNYLNLEFFKY